MKRLLALRQLQVGDVLGIWLNVTVPATVLTDTNTQQRQARALLVSDRSAARTLP